MTETDREQEREETREPFNEVRWAFDTLGDLIGEHASGEQHVPPEDGQEALDILYGRLRETEGRDREGRTYTFEVEVLPEPDAGLHGFSDRVQVTIREDPLGDPNEFPEFLLGVLREWYVTPNVRRVDITPMGEEDDGE